MGGMGGGRPGGPPADDDFEKGGRLDVGRIARYVGRYKGPVAGALLLSLVSTVLTLVPPRLTGAIIDHAVGPKDIRRLYHLTVILLAVHVTVNTINGLKGYILGKLGQTITYDLWQDVYRNLQRLSFKFYDDNDTGNLMSRVTNDVSAVERVIVGGTDMLVISVLTLIGIAVILFRTNWVLALVTMIPVPFLAFLAWFMTRQAHRVYRQVRMKMGEISALLQDTISGIREIKSFVREEYEMGRLSEKSMEYVDSSVKAIRLWSFFSPAIMTAGSMGTFLVLLTGGRIAILTGGLTAGQIVSFLMYLGLFYQPIHQLNWFNHMLQHARASSERIFEIIDAVPHVKEAPDAAALPRPVRGSVVFRDVRFAYREDEEVLHGVSFEARPGETIALVGPTGAGKTTIVSLIPRFYDVSHGAVLIDGVDVRTLLSKDLREQIGIVMQEPFLFNGTVRENIAYGKLDASLEEIVAVAKLANAHEFVSALRDGYDHPVGERGIRLSVGEKQRIAIARALLKNPPILILDEATSSVDNKTEALIQQAVENLLRNRTSFVIAHRLSTVVNADRILVVKAGEIVESGTHAELLARGGVYANLHDLQWRRAALRPAAAA